MASRRVERLNEQLKREIAEILRFEVKDPRVGLAVVTAVQVTPDLSLARVYIQPSGESDEQQETLTGLHAAAAFVRSQLAQRLRLRHVPELRFELDQSLERAQRIEQLLNEVLPPDDEEDASAGDEGASEDVAADEQAGRQDQDER